MPVLVENWPELSTYSPAFQVKLVPNGLSFLDTLISLIDQATLFIHFHMYIYCDDECGNKVLDALKRAVQRKVSVYLMLDAFGSFSLSQSYTDGFIKSGINFRWFGKFFTTKNISIRRRLHQKVLVIDQTYALLGGMNIGNQYISPNEAFPWLDFAVIVEGPIVQQIYSSCEKIWNSTPGPKAETWKNLNNLSPPPPHFTSLSPLVRVRENDWQKRKNGIYKSYLQSINHACISITIVGSYFFPGRKIKLALRRAALRGVKVRFLFTHASDVPIVTKAAQYIYRYLLKNRMQIFEWLPSIVHGKLMVVDQTWVTIGSYNLNALLGYGTIEMNLDILNSSFAQEIENKINHLIQVGCASISMDQWKKAETLRQRFLAFMAYHILKFLLRIILLLSPKEEIQYVKLEKRKMKK